jgi:hypothetical protein
VFNNCWIPGSTLRVALNDAKRNHRFSGTTSLTLATNPATSSAENFRCTRLSDGNCFTVHTPDRHSRVGRIGRGAKPPPQFGQTLNSLVSTQSAQKVHS